MNGETVNNDDGNDEKRYLTVFQCHRPCLPLCLYMLTQFLFLYVYVPTSSLSLRCLIVYV